MSLFYRSHDAVRLTLWALICAVLLLADGALTAPAEAAVSEPIQIDEPRDALDWVATAAQLLATLAALGALVFLAQQVASAKAELARAREDANAQRTLAFQERYISREFGRVATPALAFFRVTDARDCIQKLRAERTAPHAEEPCLPRTPRDASAPHACVNDIQYVLGFFEDLGTAHVHGLLNGDVLVMSFGTIPVQVFTESWWFLCAERKGHLGSETKLYLQFEQLVRWLIDREKEFDDRPNRAVRLLLLPPPDRYADAGAWDVCADLSLVLSTRLGVEDDARIAQVRQDVESIVETLQPRSRGDLIGSIVAIPPFPATNDKGWIAEQRPEAERLREHLAGLDEAQLRTVIERVANKAA